MAARLVWEERGVLLEFSGVVSLSDYQTVLTGLFSDLRFRDIHYAICDYSELTESEFGLEHVEVIASFTSSIKEIEYLAVAAVATHAETVKKAELFATQVTYPFAIFTNIIDARKWIQTKPYAL